MSGHGANPIFFNKKAKVGRPEHFFTPHPLTSDNISFLPYRPHLHPPQSGRHMCITLTLIILGFSKLFPGLFS